MTEAVNSIIDIEVRSKGIEAVGKSLDELVSSEEELVKATEKVVKIREKNEAAIDRLAKRYDLEYRALKQAEQAQKELDRARAAGLAGTTAYERALAGLERQHALSTKTMNDNTRSVGLARYEWINLSRQFQDIGVSLAGGQSPLMVLVQQGSQVADIFSSSGAGAGAALRSFGAGAVRALTSPIGIALELTAAVAGIGLAAGKAQQDLAKLGEQSRLTGLPADVLQGAKKIGAGAGLDEKASLGAFGAAAREFQAYGRNEGAVKGTLEKIDKGFLDVLDRARSAGEFVDILNEKIRGLPTAQAERLARALYQDEGGAKLIDAIQRGEISMRKLMEASGSTGLSLNQAAGAAEDMQRKIAQAAQEADNKLLNAFKNIKSPTDDIRLGWYGVVGAIADAVDKSERLQRTLSAATSWSALFKEIGGAYDKLDKMLGARPVVSLEREIGPRLAKPGDIPFPNFAEAKQAFLPKLVNAPIGEERKLFERDPRGHGARGGSSAVEREAQQYEKISRELENELRLASSVGDEHDRITLAIKIENEQLKLGKDATQAQRDHVADMVTKIDAAREAQGELNKEAKAYREAFGEVRDIAKDSVKGFIHDLEKGDSLSKSLRNTWKGFQTKIFDKTTDNLFDSLFGKSGDKSSGGGILGGLFGGGGGGAFGNLFGSLFGGTGGQKYFSSQLFSGSPFEFKFPGFPGGGMVGAPARHMFSAPISAFAGAPHFAEGGAVPVIAHAGEVILNAAQQRSVAAALSAAHSSSNGNRGASGPAAPNITIHNNAPVDVTPRVMSDGQILLHIEQRIDANNKRLSEASWRSNRR